MDLIIEGKKAVLKKGTSFDYVSENRSFSDADGYSMTISIPLDCPENFAIFQHIGRVENDIYQRKLVYDATIISGRFMKNGVLTVVEADRSEVKCQFLEGRSARNFNSSFDDVYINELNLGYYPTSSLPSCSQYLRTIDDGATCVALPWVNDNVETADINNAMVVKDGKLAWDQFTIDTGKLSFQPYLITITENLCRRLGYTFDFSEWYKHPDRFLIICNTLPAAWDIPKFARALPHWSVSQFFEELEKILVAEFDIDHKAGHISMHFCGNSEWGEYEMSIPEILDDLSAEISHEDEFCKYKGTANVKFKDRGDDGWKMDSCQWLIDLIKSENKHYKEFETEAEFLQYRLFQVPWWLNKNDERVSQLGSLCYVKESDLYYICQVKYANDPEYTKAYRAYWIAVNKFGSVVYDEDSDNNIEVEILPVRIDATDAEHGDCMFLSFSDYNEPKPEDEDGVTQPYAMALLLNGEPKEAAAYYDTLYLAYWDGTSANLESEPPCPIVYDRKVSYQDGSIYYYEKYKYNLNLKKRYGNYLGGLKIDAKNKLKISWLADSIPDVRHIFNIRSRRYLCEKITATFTDDGMSQLLKGEFYPLLE